MGNSNSHHDSASRSSNQVYWVWQSDMDPWLVNRERTWSEYPAKINTKIEKAYQEKEPKVDIGEYYVDFEAMLQVNKANNLKQRRVQRTVEGSIVQSRAERFIGVLSTMKMIYEPTNATEQFFSKIQELNFEGDKSIKFSDPVDFLAKEILQLTKSSLAKITLEAKKHVKEIGVAQNIKTYIEKALHEEKGEMPGSKVYPAILRSFTEDCFINKSLNRVLRGRPEENEVELKEWASYIMLLMYSFNGSETSWRKSYIQDQNVPKVLYRGALLYEEDVGLYDKGKHRYFCWNTFISTSKSEDVIKNLAMSTDEDLKRTKTFFTISIESYNESPSEIAQLIDLSHFSEFPGEEEVLISPGTIFEILSNEVKEGTCYVNLRVVPEKEYGLISK